MNTLFHKVDDANQRAFDSAKIQLQYANPADSDKIATLQAAVIDAEQQRLSWEKLYGEGGKLGYTKQNGQLIRIFENGQTFTPNGYSVTESHEVVDTRDILQTAIKELSVTEHHN